MTQKPEELLQQIEERLEITTPEEHRRLHFNLAKQRMTEDPEKYKERLHKYYEETLLQDEQQFVDKYVNSVYNKAMEELLRMHRPPLATIEALEKEIPYYVTQLQIYAETMPDAAPVVIAGLGGMRYGFYKGNQKARRRIWTLYHPSDLVEEEDTKDTAIMELDAITAEGD